MGKALLFIHQPDRVAQKASDVSDCLIGDINTREKISYFLRVLLRFF